jgi:predicted TIM-barrel fold metal-dependent hydrolase
MSDIYAALEGRLPVLFHVGDYRYTFSHPSRLVRVLDNFPGLCVIAAHFGGWTVFDIAYDYFRKRSCYFDISASLPLIGPRRAVELIRDYGHERFLFGSDSPMFDPSNCLEEFMLLNLTDTEKEYILWKNALEILGNDN